MSKPELKCTVVQNKFVTPTIFLLRFTSEPSFQFQAGQFVSAIIPGAGPKGRDLRRAYSLASSPEESEFELCIKAVQGGPGSTYLSSLKPGTSFQALAPYGDFIYKTKPGRIPCFIATGTGLAPFRSILTSEEYKKNPAKKAICLFGTTINDEIIYQNDLSEIDHLDFKICLSRESDTKNFFKGRVSHYTQKEMNQWNLQEMDFYLCGNGAMIKEIKELLTARDVQKSAIFQEKYY